MRSLMLMALGSGLFGGCIIYEQQLVEDTAEGVIQDDTEGQIGRASCRERVYVLV